MKNRVKDFIKKNLKPIISIPVVVILASVAATFLIVGLNKHVKSSIHDEREKYLSVQMETSAELTNKAIEKYANYTTTIRKLIEEKITENSNVHTFLNDFEKYNYFEETRLILVDENNLWYSCAVPSETKLQQTGYITSIVEYSPTSPNSVIYMTVGEDANNRKSICFKENLSQPVSLVNNNGETINIESATIIIYLDSLYSQVGSAFPYTSNRYFIDSYGTITAVKYDEAIGNLIDEISFYTKLEKSNLLYGDTKDSLIEKLNQSNALVAEFEHNDEDYFVCAAKLNTDNGWAVGFVMRSSDLDAGNYLPVLLNYVIGIVGILAFTLLCFVILTLLNASAKRRLEVEKEAKVYLERAATAKSKFLSNMSHDMRTPINGILGMSMIAKKEDNPPKTLECLANIDQVAKHMLGLVNDILDMASLESGKAKTNLSVCNLNELVNNCSLILKGYMRDRTLNFIPEIDDLKHKYVSTDETKLKEIIINNLSNAVKYTPDGGSIYFRMKEIESNEETVHIQFEIQDTGIGMSKEFCEHAFEEFSQEASQSFKSEYKGTGLGLSIVKKYTELLNGVISVESELGKGSKFTLNFTFKCEEAPQEIINKDIKGAKILLVEDNEINLMIATEMLEKEGVNVTPARNGKEALELFTKSKEKEFNVILMDLMMPIMNGYDATRAIRVLERTDAISVPIIAMTGKTFADEIKEAMDCGMNNYINKPVDFDKLIITIGKYYTPEKK